jgi:3-mercaptopyruvate sulfurtransferase SseA
MKSAKKIFLLTNVFLLLFFLAAAPLFAGGGRLKSRVTTDWVAANLDSIKLVDVCGDDFTRGHLPGAVKMQWGEEVLAQGENYMLPPNLAETRRVIRRMGLSPKDHVVLYEADVGMKKAMRVYWVLKFWNFPKVSIMDGGLALWQSENRSLIFKSTMADRNEY